jgi:hypothetical protein
VTASGFSGNVNATGLSTFSGGVVVAAGTAAAPSISPTGNSNTGIFFPSADTVAIAEGGVEALIIHSSSNIGIGTTNPLTKVHIQGTGNGSSGSTGLSDSSSASALLLKPIIGSGTALALGTRNTGGHYIQGLYAASSVESVRDVQINPYGGSVGIGTFADAFGGSPGSSTFVVATTGLERLRITSAGTLESYSPDDTTPNIKWRSNDTNWFGSLNQSVEGGTITSFLSCGGDWSANGTTYSATKALAAYPTSAIAVHNQYNSNWGSEFVFLTKAGGSSTTDGAVSERLRITSGGNVQIANGNLVFSTAGTGIDFSATGNATNGSNVSELLSDYEQGTWTATLSCANSGAVTLLNNAGHYTRIGNICHVGAWVRVNGSTTGSASGNISMGGFPFPATNQGSYRGRIHITGYLMANISTGTWGWGVVEDDTSTFPLGYGQNAWNGFTAFAGTNIASTSAEFYVNGFYKVA